MHQLVTLEGGTWFCPWLMAVSQHLGQSLAPSGCLINTC